MLWFCRGHLRLAAGAEGPATGLPAVAAGWRIEPAADARQVLFPTAIAAAPDGTVYVGSDPMDMIGPPTEPIDRVLAIKDGKSRVFAEKLWCVQGTRVGRTGPFSSSMRLFSRPFEIATAMAKPTIALT